MMLSVHYCKLHRKKNESAWKWVGTFCIKATECDKRLKEQFINSIDDEEIIKELMPKRTQEIDSEQVLMWVQRFEAQKAHTEVLDKMKT